MLVLILTVAYRIRPFAQYFRAPKRLAYKLFVVPFHRHCLARSLTQLSFPRFSIPPPGIAGPCPPTCSVAHVRKFSSSICQNQEIKLLPASMDRQRTPQFAVPTHETSPASFGINGWFGYERFISPGTRLPCTKSVKLISALDYIEQDELQICGFLPTTRLRVGLAVLRVVGIRKAEKEKTKVEATMVLRTDLTGTFTARFMSEVRAAEDEVSVTFCGGQVLNQRETSGLVTTDSGSFHIIEDCRKDSWIRSWFT